MILGEILYHQGELTSALEYLERGFALYDPQQHGDLAFVYARDPGVQCLSNMSLALWQLGYPDRALRKDVL